ncbi:hypothetical protein G6653_04855 [Polynucleobacter paneuropaeus]|jgi:protoporphyrinogen oxidase|nr:hypothetical protein [Polynucleobacter paneuropaeus]MBT8610782.1 hypothetical protein [Polynucleobacter paneuropaeus]
MTTYILGAGPAGMAVVDGMVDSSAGSFVLLEQSKSLGGLAQTIAWEGVGDHDLGPHKIFSLDKSLIARIEALLPIEGWLTREKISTIYINGHYLPYPPSPFSLAGVFGLTKFIKMVFGYGIAQISSLINVQAPSTFEQDLQGRLGAPLYNILFKPIAEKLWADPKTLDVKLSRGRVQTPSLFEVFGRLLRIKKNSAFEALTFRYPKGGLGRLWNAIAAKSLNHGKILLSHTVTGLVVEGGRVRQIKFSTNGKEGVFDLCQEDNIVSTLPLTHTIKILKESLPPNAENLSKNIIVLNDLLLVFLHIDTPSLVKESWVFIPDPKVIFHRLSEQESFDPSMTPNGSIVCCEIMSSDSRRLSNKTDEELIFMAIEGLNEMGYVGFNVISQKVIRLPKSYPVFNVGFEAGLKELLVALDSFENFKSIGRQGAFNYIGTLDAMDIGYGFVNWMTQNKTLSWVNERERTNHYPVLD